MATTNPSCTFGMPQASTYHQQTTMAITTGVSTRPRNDDERLTVPAGCQKYADDADGPTANGHTHVDEPLCPQPAAQPDAGVFLFLTSRGG